MTAAELKKARKRLGLTQKKMAEELNTPYRTYQDWERKMRRVPGMCDIAIPCIEKAIKGRKKNV
jgi:DNA-binding transcriptional regulator YiaG